MGQTAGSFAPWIKHEPGRGQSQGNGAIVVFPHAGAAAASYRKLAAQLAMGGDTFVVQYPGRAERLRHPAPETIPDLARELVEAGPWERVAPLRLFGHSMGALVAFEFARLAEQRGIGVRTLWVSAGPPPATVSTRPPLPTSTNDVLADITEMGGTDPQLLADEEFADLLVDATRNDYAALNRYDCGDGVHIDADIHAIGGRHDSRVDAQSLHRWAEHTRGSFTLTLFDGGHFYLDEHAETVPLRVITDN